MQPHDDQPLEDLLAHSRARTEQFNSWLDQLRAGDPVFAEASPLYPDDMNEWQAATYLLTGCDEVWRAVRRHVAQIKQNCPRRALDCRPKQRQALLH